MNIQSVPVAHVEVRKDIRLPGSFGRFRRPENNTHWLAPSTSFSEGGGGGGGGESAYLGLCAYSEEYGILSIKTYLNWCQYHSYIML